MVFILHIIYIYIYFCLYLSFIFWSLLWWWWWWLKFHSHDIILYSLSIQPTLYTYAMAYYIKQCREVYRKVPELCCQRVIPEIILFHCGVKYISSHSFSPCLWFVGSTISTLSHSHCMPFSNAHLLIPSQCFFFSLSAVLCNFLNKITIFGWILIADVFYKMWPHSRRAEVWN